MHGPGASLRLFTRFCHPGCRLSAAEQNEVETWFTVRWNMLVPYHNLYWTGGSVYTGARNRPERARAADVAMGTLLMQRWLCKMLMPC